MIIWLHIQTSASMPGMWAASFMMAKHSRRWYSQSYKRVQVSIVKDPGHPTIKRVCLLLSAKQYLSQGSTNYSHLKHCDRLTKPCLSQAWTSLQYNHTYKTAKTNQLSCSARDGHAHTGFILSQTFSVFKIMVILGFKIQRYSNKWHL